MTASDQTPKAEQLKGGFTDCARLAKINIELCHPVIRLRWVDEHLLNTPVTLVCGGRDVGVTHVPRFGIEAEVRVFDVVSFQCAPEAFSGPRLVIGGTWGVDVGEGGLEV